MSYIAFHPIYKHHLKDGHRFPMLKYELLPQQLLHEGTCKPSDFFKPDIAKDDSILAVHTASYYEKLSALSIDKKEARKIGFPLSKELILRERIIAGGTIKGCEIALKTGIAMNIAGGTHHAFSDRAEAFCMLNDQAIGARFLQAKKLAKKILIVDLDVHQGNGTASIFQNDISVFTFSMHGAANYPFRKEHSDLDIALEKNTDDNHYLNLLKEQLPKLIDQEKPDFIFYLCGVDVLATDKLGTLRMSLEGCKQRDEIVLETCFRHQIPVQCSMGGGYSPEIKTIIEAHANTFRIAKKIFF